MKNSKSLKSYLLLLFHTRCISNFVRILGNIGSVVGRLIVGKEGLLVHVGACIALKLVKADRSNVVWHGSGFQYLKNDKDHHDLVTCGVGAGVVVAFHAPIGGVLFASKEVTS
jgi:chloride channel 3/4/5